MVHYCACTGVEDEILDRNFDTCEIPHFSWAPEVETILIENPEASASGCGEPPIVTMGAVIANTIYDAVGAAIPSHPTIYQAERIRRGQ